MIALDPNQRFEFTLDEEAYKTAGTRLHFASRFPTALQLAELDRLTDEANGKKLSEAKTLLLAALRVTTVTLTPPISQPERVDVWLDGEAAIEPAQRHLFTCPRLDREKLESVNALLAKAAGTLAAVEVPLLREAFAHCVIHITHADKPDPASIRDALSIQELREICGRAVLLSRLSLVKTLEELEVADLYAVATAVIREAHLTEIDRKKSALQWASAAARRRDVTARTGRA